MTTYYSIQGVREAYTDRIGLRFYLFYGNDDDQNHIQSVGKLGNLTKTTVHNHRIHPEYNSEGNPVGEPPETVNTYTRSMTFSGK